MKVVILCGGMGTRLREETEIKTQTNGRNRRNANPMAYNENICLLWF